MTPDYDCSREMSLQFDFYHFKSDRYICLAQSRNRYNSGIVPRKVGILTLLRKVGILTLRKIIPELSLRKMRIRTK